MTTYTIYQHISPDNKQHHESKKNKLKEQKLWKKDSKQSGTGVAT